MTIDMIEAPVVSAGEFLEAVIKMTDGNRVFRCIQCGTCSGVCPFGFCMDYTPRKLIGALRMNELDQVFTSARNWMCVSCYACSEVCPQQIPLASVLMHHLKEELLIHGLIPAELQQAMENSQHYGNPQGESPRKRADWAAGLDVPVLSQARQPVEVLWFVGDYAAYHPAACAATRAFARILQALGVRFGILGHEEVSDGDSQRMAGEIGLFEMLAEKNGRAFRKYAFQEIVTTDPHAYNALRHEYPKLGFAYPVRHYTQFLAERLDALRPMLTRPVQATTTFHDPCYLGRVNKVYEEPRALLEAIPGLQLVEMTHSRSMSLCCGGGGGGMWLDGYQWDVAHARTTGWRVQELVAARPLQDFLSVIGQNGSGKKRKALEPGPPSRRVLAVACPYEKPRFGDAIKVVGRPRDLQVLDLAELLTEAMGI